MLSGPVGMNKNRPQLPECDWIALDMSDINEVAGDYFLATVIYPLWQTLVEGRVPLLVLVITRSINS